MNNDDYTSTVTAKILKEIGYTESSFRYTVDETGQIINIPTLWDAQKWLRKEKHIELVLTPYQDDNTMVRFYDIDIYFTLYGSYDHMEEIQCTLRYEQALNEGIKEAAKLIKE